MITITAAHSTLSLTARPRIGPERTKYPRATIETPIITRQIVGRRNKLSSYLVFNSRSSSVIIETGKRRRGELYALTAAGSSCCWSHSKNSMPASALISSPASRPIFSASAGAPTLLER